MILYSKKFSGFEKLIRSAHRFTSSKTSFICSTKNKEVRHDTKAFLYPPCVNLWSLQLAWFWSNNALGWSALKILLEEHQHVSHIDSMWRNRKLQIIHLEEPINLIMQTWDRKKSTLSSSLWKILNRLFKWKIRCALLYKNGKLRSQIQFFVW